MSEEKPKSRVERIFEAIIKRIEGGSDAKQKYDYITNPPNIKTTSILSEVQLDSVAECHWLGDNFPSLLPLKELALELARWSPSKAGKGREQLTATMITEHKEILPYSVQELVSKKKKKEKKEEED